MTEMLEGRSRRGEPPLDDVLSPNDSRAISSAAASSTTIDEAVFRIEVPACIPSPACGGADRSPAQKAAVQAKSRYAADNEDQEDDSEGQQDEKSGDDKSGAEESEGLQLVEAIMADAREIGRFEAARLVKIAQLYRSKYMRPHPASAVAQSLAKKQGRLVRDLDREDTTRAELVSCLRLRDHDARRLISTALALTARFPATLLALADGRLDLTRVHLIAEVATPMLDHQYQLALSAGLSPGAAEAVAANIAAELEKHILKRAPTQGPHNLRDCLTRGVHRLDPDYADRTTKDNLASRQVTCRTNRGDGTGDLYAHLGAAEAQGIYAVLDAYARAARYGGSQRSLNELRADALTHLILYGHMPDGSTLARPADIGTIDATVVPPVDPDTGDIYRDPADPNCPPPPNKINFFTKPPTGTNSPTTRSDKPTTYSDEPTTRTNKPTARFDEPSARAADGSTARPDHPDASSHGTGAEQLDLTKRSEHPGARSLNKQSPATEKSKRGAPQVQQQ